VAELKRAQDLDPLSRAISTTHGYVLYLARENDAAIGQLCKALDLDANFAVAHMYLGRAYAQKKMFAHALEEFQKADDLSGGEPYFRAWLGYGYAVSERSIDARKVLNELKKLPKSKYVPLYDVAAIWMGLGDKGQALKWLEKAYEDHASYFSAVKVEPVFDGLHSDPHFQDLVLVFINTITYYLRFLSPPCYARFGRALICHEKARTKSSLPNKSERSCNDAPINIRYHILLWRGPR
jgi:tetratricopeptide (TPR) repeat protein